MFSIKSRRSIRFAMLLLAVSLAAFGTMDPAIPLTTARANAAVAGTEPSEPVGVESDIPTAGAPSGHEPQDMPTTAQAGAAAAFLLNDPVREQLAKISTHEQLIQEMKRYPVFHPDRSQFLDAVEVTATGYYAGLESTGKSPGHPQYGITYSGVKVRQSVLSTIAADPKVFPLGTILYIPGYGYGIVADTGSAIKGNKIDLYFPTKEQVYAEWGKRTVRVFVVTRGDGRVSEQTLNDWENVWTLYKQ